MFNICDISLFDFERSSFFLHLTFRQFFISSTLVHLSFSATLLQDY